MFPADPPIRLHAAEYKEAGPRYHAGLHAQSRWQWYCVILGGVDYFLASETLPLGPEQSVLVPPGAQRAPRCRGRSPRYLYLVFDNLRLDLDGIAARRLDLPRVLHPDLLALVDELRVPAADRDLDLVLAISVRLLIGLIRGGEHDDERPALLNARSQEATVARVEAHMRARLGDAITREELARVANMSASQLARVFHAATGRSPMERLGELRIERAKELLLETTLPIAQVALRVGHNSFSNFSKRFREQVGVSPSDYRRADGRDFGPHVPRS